MALVAPRQDASSSGLHYAVRGLYGEGSNRPETSPKSAINELFIYTQPAHLQKLSGSEMNSANRNIERARYLRQHLEGSLTTENGGDGA